MMSGRSKRYWTSDRYRCAHAGRIAWQVPRNTSSMFPRIVSIRDGEFLCAIGPSECGKTTLLNLIAGFIEPTRGELRFDRIPISRPAPERGVVFQEYALFPWLTALRNVEFGLKMQGMAKAERRERANEALKLVGLAGAARRYPFELSGGMRQRVAVARALVYHPRILLMDEPFAAVDALTRASLQTELLRIWEEVGITIFFITHNIEEAVYLGDRIVVMSPNPGRIQETVEWTSPGHGTGVNWNSAGSMQRSTAFSIGKGTQRHDGDGNGLSFW